MEKRILDKVSYEDWKHVAERYNFSEPCIEIHADTAGQFSYQKCYTLDIRGSRRRTVQFRYLLSRYSAELEQGHNGHHNMHVRDLLTSNFYVVPLQDVNGSIRELDFMIDPVLTVVAYQEGVIVITVQEKTKNIPKLALFCDLLCAKDLGHHLVPVNYNNLNATQINCAISPDRTTVAICVVEDHYDEFVMHFRAFKLSHEDTPIITTLCDIKCPHTTWYEPTTHMSFLPNADNVVVVLGDIPFTVTSDPSRYLLMYDIDESSVLRCVSLKDNLYPVSLSCSLDGTWISTLSRNVSERDGELETYITKMYFSETLTQHMEVQGPLSCDAYNSTSNCNKVVMCKSGHLVAIASTSEFDSVVEFDPWGPNLFYHGTSSVEMTVYRLPIVRPTLKGLCRDTIVESCKFDMLSKLPLPSSLIKYVSYKQ